MRIALDILKYLLMAVGMLTVALIALAVSEDAFSSQPAAIELPAPTVG